MPAPGYDPDLGALLAASREGLKSLEEVVEGNLAPDEDLDRYALQIQALSTALEPYEGQ